MLGFKQIYEILIINYYKDNYYS